MSNDNLIKPGNPPIGLLVVQTAKTVARAFEESLAAAGGSLPLWLILMALMRGGHGTQADLAKEVGIQGPTLTHHLNTMEKNGLLTRSRLPNNRRVHQVELTEAGRAMFQRLRQSALAFDGRLRRRFDGQEIETLREMLERLAENAAR